MKTSRIESCSRNQFLEAISVSDYKKDAFARTFRAKADAMDLWEHCSGLFLGGGVLAAAIVVRCSKRSPVVANLQLLHTFARFRRRGYARELVVKEFLACAAFCVPYFRVSAEQEALPFYRSLGFKFWGRQKSGSELSIFRIAPDTEPPTRFAEIRSGIYDPEDLVIRAAVFSKRKGGVVELHEGGPK